MSESRTAIVVALIGLVGVVAAAVISHLPQAPAPPQPSPASSALPQAPVAASQSSTSSRQRVQGSVHDEIDEGGKKTHAAGPPTAPIDYSGPWIDQYDQKVAVVESGSSVTLRWHDGNQTIQIAGSLIGDQFSGKSDSAARPDCTGGFQNGTHIGIVCHAAPGIPNNWTFRLLRATG
jgi:hypothetical protein